MLTILSHTFLQICANLLIVCVHGCLGTEQQRHCPLRMRDLPPKLQIGYYSIISVCLRLNHDFRRNHCLPRKQTFGSNYSHGQPIFTLQGTNLNTITTHSVKKCRRQQHPNKICETLHKMSHLLHSALTRKRSYTRQLIDRYLRFIFKVISLMKLQDHKCQSTACGPF